MKVEYITHSGNDLLVANAARVSLDKHHEYFDYSDDKLIAYLAAHNHWTPFGHPHITLRITAPIFVARQLFKHKVGFTNSDDFVENEVSRRYVDSDPDMYITDKLGKRAENKKQGAIEGEFIEQIFNGRWDSIEETLGILNAYGLHIYKMLLENNVAPEDARMVLPLSTYTSWYWTGSLFAYSRMYNLRIKEDTQRQSREIAKLIGNIIQPLYPFSWGALIK